MSSTTMTVTSLLYLAPKALIQTCTLPRMGISLLSALASFKEELEGDCGTHSNSMERAMPAFRMETDAPVSNRPLTILVGLPRPLWGQSCSSFLGMLSLITLSEIEKALI